MLSLAGIDLILPAIPSLPAALSGTPTSAQLVLASYVTGTGLGLLLYGRLADFIDRRILLMISFVLLAGISAGSMFVSNIEALIILRVLQGAAASAAAVFAPGFIRQMLPPTQSMRTIGFMGSMESLSPALAPIAGAYFISKWGWQSAFAVVSFLAVCLLAGTILVRGAFPAVLAKESAGSYAKLLRDPVYHRYALSYAFALGGLLVFVFGAPSLLVSVWKGTIADFITVQVAGVSTFILAANLGHRLVKRIGEERTINLGTLLMTLSAFSLFLYGLLEGRDYRTLAALFIPMNIGLGLRGPPGFFLTIVASKGDDSRGSALMILAIMLVTAGGTAMLAPFIQGGLLIVGGASAALLVCSVLTLRFLPRFEKANLPVLSKTLGHDVKATDDGKS